MKVDAIFFDLGMVLVTFDWNDAIARFATQSGNNPEAVRQFLSHPYHDAFERNELTGQEFFERGRELMGFTGTSREFQDAWSEIFTEIPTTVRMLRQLARSYTLYTLSNTNPWHAAYLEKHFEWMNLFTERFYSFTLGARKPDRRIYELAVAHAGIEPARALFIDDRLENIEGARAIGMQTLYAPTPAVLVQELTKILPTADMSFETSRVP